MALLRRSATYYSRTFVPADVASLVGRVEVLKSLRTRNAREARLRASMWEGHLARLFGTLRKTHRTMDRDSIAALVADYLAHRFDEAEEHLALNTDPVAREARAADVNWELHRVERQLADGDHGDTLPVAQQMLPSAADEAHRVLARRLLEAKYEALLAEMKGYQGEPLKRPVLVTATTHPAKKAPALTLSELVSRFVEFNREGNAWSPKTDRSVSAMLGVVVALLGDRPVASFTKDDMRAMRSLLARVPRHAVRRYKGMTLQHAADAADAKKDADRLSPKSVNMHLVWTRTVWKWAVEHDLAASNPTVVLQEFKEEDARVQRASFTHDQVRAFLRVLEEERDTDAAVWWVPRLMLATGARLEEIAKLRPRDVREQDGHTIIDINADAGRLKTADSARVVPVHSSLAELLVAHRDRVAGESGDEANLWGLERQSDGTFSKYLSRTLNRRLAKAGVKSRKLVMESARNTFASDLYAQEVPELVIADLMGHRGGATMTGQRYVSKTVLEKRAAAVARLTIPLV